MKIEIENVEQLDDDKQQVLGQEILKTLYYLGVNLNNVRVQFIDPSAPQGTARYMRARHSDDT